MPDKFEIDVPLPLDGVIERLEAARKEMAPKIGTCTVAPDKSWFVCTVSYGQAYALLRGQQQETTNDSKILVETRIAPIKPLIATTVILVFLSILLDAFVIHPKAAWEWLCAPVFIMVLVSIPMLLVPLSKQVLDRFIRDTLLNDAQR